MKILGTKLCFSRLEREQILGNKFGFGKSNRECYSAADDTQINSLYKYHKNMAKMDNSSTSVELSPRGLPSIAVLDNVISEFEIQEAVNKISGNVSPYAAISSYWTQGALTPVPKPVKDIKEEDCRPIAVTPLPFWILSSILSSRPETFSSLRENRFASRTNRNTSDAIFVLQTICEKMVVRKRTVFWPLLTFQMRLTLLIKRF